ncbi:MAG TPA: DUF5719 family protein [Nocardioidaceae bacterium]|nr:DUF5719 family protein [Nocardioidaceae bacterium]
MPLVVLVILAGLLGLATVRASEPAPAPPASTELPLSQTDLTCPSVGAAKLPASKAGIGVTSHAGGKTGGDGGVEVTPLPDGKADKPEPAPAAGVWSVVQQGDDAAQPVLVSATGSMATGAAAFAATRADDEAGGGLAVTSCPPPAREAWFLGAGSTVSHSSTLLLSNPGVTDAIVDVSLLTSEGLKEPVSTTGLAIESHDVERLSLSDFAAGEGEAVIQVAASQGQVTAQVLDYWSATLAPAGTEWIPTAQPPDTTLTVTPAIEDAGRQDLILGNPGDRTATVDIQVIGPNGTFPVKDFESASVDEGGVDVVPIPKSVGGETVALQLEADQPIVASVRSTSGDSPADIAYGTSAPEISDPAIVPVDLTSIDPSGVSLAVTSAEPDAEATLSVEVKAEDGSSLGERTLTVPAGRTVSWRTGNRADLGTNASKVAYLVVTPRSGTVRAAAVYESDDAWSSLPLQSAPTYAVAPGVYPLD